MNLDIAVLLLVSMIFCHLLYDFHLQGCLANLKQKKWWKKQFVNEIDQLKYGQDYIMGIITHALEWAIWVELPLILYQIITAGSDGVGIFTAVTLVLNIIIHGVIDNLKANKFKINLIVDQIFHYTQILMTFACFVVWF